MNYPVIDPDTGMGVLEEKIFNMNSIMPICLPPNKYFKDQNKRGVIVGVGIRAEKTKSTRCFTDGNGPEAFQQCSTLWVDEEMVNYRDDDKYDFAWEAPPKSCSKEAPPSIFNGLCKDYHQKITELK